MHQRLSDGTFSTDLNSNPQSTFEHPGPVGLVNSGVQTQDWHGKSSKYILSPIWYVLLPQEHPAARVSRPGGAAESSVCEKKKRGKLQKLQLQS